VINRLARALPFYYGWVIVAVVFLTMAIGVNARTAFSLVLPQLIDEFGWDRGVTAGAFSAGFMVSAVLTPLMGRMMDRRGPVLVMEFGVLATAAGLLLAPLATAPWHIYATLGVLVGAGSVCHGYTGQSLFLPGWFARRRGFATSVAFSGVGIGSILLLPAMQIGIEAVGWRQACVMLAVAMVVICAPINLLLRRRPQDLGMLPDGDLQPAAGVVPLRQIRIVDPAWAAVTWTLGRAIRTARFWLLAIGFFGALYTWYAVQVHQTKYLVDIGFGAREAAWALGAVSLAGIPGQIALGVLSDRIGREAVWVIGCMGFVLTYLALLALPLWPTPLLFWAMVLVQGGLGYGITSVLGSVVVEIFEGPHFGTIFGAIMLAGLLGGAAGPFITGFLHDLTGSYALGFWLGIAAALLAAWTICLAAPRKIRSVVTN